MLYRHHKRSIFYGDMQFSVFKVITMTSYTFTFTDKALCKECSALVLIFCFVQPFVKDLVTFTNHAYVSLLMFCFASYAVVENVKSEEYSILYNSLSNLQLMS